MANPRDQDAPPVQQMLFQVLLFAPVVLACSTTSGACANNREAVRFLT
jgi:hypothetical protein